MDESFPAKHFKLNKMINCAISGSEATLQVIKQVVGLEIPNRLIICFTEATCQSNRAVIRRISFSLTRL